MFRNTLQPNWISPLPKPSLEDMEYFFAIGLLVLSTILGLLWRSRQGKVSKINGTTLSLDYREQGKTTLVQFTTELCAPCAALKPRLEKIALFRGDVAYRQVDAVEHIELSSSLKVSSTPTTFVVTSEGKVVARINGLAPDQVFIDAIDGKINNANQFQEETTI